MSTVERAVVVLASGGVVGIPTDTIYGLGVNPRIDGATARLFAVKGRPETVALPVLIAEPGEATELAHVPPAAHALAERFWPGSLTLVLSRLDGVHLDLGGDPATIGIRCPAHPVARRLLLASGPLAVSSANRHGEPPATTPEAVSARFADTVTTVIDGGVCDGSPSTVVSFVGPEPLILREGALGRSEIEQALAGH
jgi:L-threonylcarbamoyladenylate synthase